MSNKAKKIFERFRKLEGKNLFAILFLIAFTSGLADAAISQRLSDTVEGNIQVSRGINFSVYNVSGGESDTSFRTNLRSGGELYMDFEKENNVDDMSDPSVETAVMDIEGEDLSWKYVESIESFRQSSSEARKYRLNVSFRGDPVVTEKHFEGTGAGNWSLEYNETLESATNNYFGVVDADVDSDSQNEILVCISEEEGTRYQANEGWKGNLSIDTKSSFPTGETEMEIDVLSLYNPETGAHPARVRECPQFN